MIIYVDSQLYLYFSSSPFVMVSNADLCILNFVTLFILLSNFLFFIFMKAMHGVGSQWILRAFDLFGHTPFIPVLSQAEPDPDFQTVTFPNPEEKGVN